MDQQQKVVLFPGYEGEGDPMEERTIVRPMALEISDVITLVIFFAAISLLIGLMLGSLFPMRNLMKTSRAVSQPHPIGYECQQVVRQNGRTVGEDCRVIYPAASGKKEGR